MYYRGLLKATLKQQQLLLSKGCWNVAGIWEIFWLVFSFCCIVCLGFYGAV